MLYNVIHLHPIELTDLYIINVMHMLNLLCDIDIKLLLIQFFVQAEVSFLLTELMFRSCNRVLPSLPD